MSPDMAGVIKVEVDGDVVVRIPGKMPMGRSAALVQALQGVSLLSESNLQRALDLARARETVDISWIEPRRAFSTGPSLILPAIIVSRDESSSPVTSDKAPGAMSNVSVSAYV